MRPFPVLEMCCKCSSNVQKSTVTILVMCIHMFVCVHCPLQCLCRCRRKISQLIEYLKLPNRNFKFITQCRQATGHIQPTAGSQWSVHSTAITFLDVWLSALSHSFFSSLCLALLVRYKMSLNCNLVNCFPCCITTAATSGHPPRVLVTLPRPHGHSRWLVWWGGERGCWWGVHTY